MRSFLVALSSLTIIPLKLKGEVSEDDRTKSLAWFPLVGLLLGAGLVLINLISSFLFPPLIATALVLITFVIFTGALPLEGFANTWGGFFSRKGQDEALVIKDERYLDVRGVVALFSLLLIKFVLLYSLLERGEFTALFLMPVMGRWAMVIVGTLTPYGISKNNPLASSQDDYSRSLLRASVLTFLISLLLFRFFVIPLMITVCLLVLALRRFSLKKAGEITANVRGATAELMEITTLLLINLI